MASLLLQRQGEGVAFAVRLGSTQLCCDLDSLGVVNAVQALREDNSLFGRVVDDVQCLLRRVPGNITVDTFLGRPTVLLIVWPDFLWVVRVIFNGSKSHLTLFRTCFGRQMYLGPVIKPFPRLSIN